MANKHMTLEERVNVKKFLEELDSNKTSKKQLISINGSMQEVDTDSINNAIRELRNTEDEMSPEFIRYKDSINILCIKAIGGFLINGQYQSQEDIINYGLLLQNKYHKLVDLPYIIINKKHYHTDELIRYFSTVSKVVITTDKKYSNLDRILMKSVPKLEVYKTGSKLKAKPKDMNLYTLSMGIEDILAMIDNLMENFIKVEYGNLCFVRNSRYPIHRSKIKDPRMVLENIKFPYLGVDWVCTNLHKHFINNSGHKKLFSSNDLIEDSEDLAYNKYNDLTLEESLITTLYDIESSMVHSDGYSYLDIPILYNEDEVNISNVCRFVYLHGKARVNTGSKIKIADISKSDIYNNVLAGCEMYSISLSENELLENIVRLLENDIVFNKILEFYNLALDTFTDRLQLFKDHVIEFDLEQPELKINIKDHIFKYRYLEAQEVLTVEKDEYENTDTINNFILNGENANKELSTSARNILGQDLQNRIDKENKMKEHGKETNKWMRRSRVYFTPGTF